MSSGEGETRKSDEVNMTRIPYIYVGNCQKKKNPLTAKLDGTYKTAMFILCGIKGVPSVLNLFSVEAC